MRYALIMAGGAGTRLWPLSRKATPKQLAPLIDGKSLLELAVERLEGLIPRERVLLCTGEVHRPLIRKTLPDIPDAQILGEPVGRDTLNAVGFGAAVVEKLDPGATMGVFTADHLIEPVADFQRDVDLAFRLVEEDERRLATLSIAPTFPATGFGYIERGEPIDIERGEGRAFRVRRFVEKPDLAKAREYVDSGDFGWNSGMFIWRASTILRAIEAFQPEAHAGLSRIAEAWGGTEQKSMLESVYPTLPKTSVDYGVMEPAAKDERFTICTVMSDVSWRDVGAWSSYAETLTADASGVRTAGAGKEAISLHDCKETFVFNAEGAHRVALLGVEGLVVVHTKDATLIMSAERAEELKALHGELPEELK